LFVYRASLLPDPVRTTAVWRQEAERLGIGELFLCRVERFSNERADPTDLGFDAAVEFQPDWRDLGRPLRRGAGWRLSRGLRLSDGGFGRNRIYEYGAVVRRMLDRPVP